MSRTKVKNLSGKAVRLQLNSGGVVSNLLPGGKLLKDGDSHSIHIPVIPTYREYWCIVGDPDGKKVILSSDDCAEFAEIELKSKNGVVRWYGKKPRNGAGAEDSSPPASPSPSREAASSSASSPAALSVASKDGNQGTRTNKGHCTII